MDLQTSLNFDQPKPEGDAPLTQLQLKIQKLIDNYKELKEKYDTLVHDRDTIEASYMELDDNYKQLKETCTQLEDNLQAEKAEKERMISENETLNTRINEFDNVSKVAVSKIDLLLSQMDILTQ